MNFICLLDWDGTLRRGTTTLDFAQFCSVTYPEASVQAQAIGNILAKRSEMSYDDLIERVNEKFFEIVSRIHYAELEKLENEFVETRLELYEYSLELLRKLRNADFAIFIISGAPASLVRKATKAFVPPENISGIEYIVDRGWINDISGRLLGTFSGKLEAIETILGNKLADLAIGDAPADAALFSKSHVSVLLSESDRYKKYGYAGKKPTYVVQRDFVATFIESIIKEAQKSRIRAHAFETVRSHSA